MKQAMRVTCGGGACTGSLMRTMFGSAVSHRIIPSHAEAARAHPRTTGWLGWLACLTKALWEGGSRPEMEVEATEPKPRSARKRRSQRPLQVQAKESPRAAAAAAAKLEGRANGMRARERKREREKRDSSCATPQSGKCFHPAHAAPESCHFSSFFFPILFFPSFSGQFPPCSLSTHFHLLYLNFLIGFWRNVALHVAPVRRLRRPGRVRKNAVYGNDVLVYARGGWATLRDGGVLRSLFSN
jgi:hypothetical protein